MTTDMIRWCLQHTEPGGGYHDQKKREEAYAELAAMEEAAILHEAVADMQHKRIVEATKLWQQATGTNSKLHPDIGSLLAWFIDQIARKDDAIRLLLTVFHVRDGEPSEDMYVEKCAREKAKAALTNKEA